MILVQEQRIDSKIQTQIDKLRNELVETGLKKGFTHSHTIQLSQQLDKLLNNVLIR
ncbi:aspartyl-phosphate phosphatase Spo0E family protein [Schinkia azotoformans]|uniref:aspartyl-phosphate phosphatase Spo0E family protein n=1 Tax=Schinkia azotoformans TaxID=1454 RepID=UPI002DBCF372|nr:aspartyl-phosphate phosphatase Spo0E family protein [Schinkia azotoformans]MEC1725870.1 aspartyl-phosphate phosphatase Spo0E family protein [Schinkia azotoformans]